MSGHASTVRILLAFEAVGKTDEESSVAYFLQDGVERLKKWNEKYAEKSDNKTEKDSQKTIEESDQVRACILNEY